MKLDEKSNLIASARPRPITLSEELRKKTIVGISAGGYHSAIITGMQIQHVAVVLRLIVHAQPMVSCTLSDEVANSSSVMRA